MDLRQLEMFEAIVETGSFTGAGEKLNVSQSAVSRQIKILEEELGDQLFRRIHRKVYLTATGEILLQHSRKVFQDLRVMTSKMDDLAELRRGNLRIGGGMSVCSYLFPNLLKEYHRRYPNIELTITTGTNDENIRMIRANQLDTALLSLPFLDEDLVVYPAQREEMVLVTLKDHPLAGKKEISFKDLAPYTFIHFEKGSNTRKLVDRLFIEEDVEFGRTMELQNVEIIKPLVEIDLGISIIPYPAIAQDRKRGSLHCRRIEGRKIYREMGWVALHSDYVAHSMRALLDLFEEMKTRLAPVEFPG